MQHPVLYNNRGILLYLLPWIVLAAIQVSILHFFYNIDPIDATVQSVVFYIIYMVLGLGLWYPLRYIYQMEGSQGTRILNILALGTITILVWYGLASAMVRWILVNDTVFLGFIRNALPLNISIGILLYLILILVYFLIIYLTSLEEQKVTEAQLQTLVRESELNVLKYKLNPHFLFNSLNSISALTISEPDKAQEMVIKLSDYLRYSLETEQIPVKDLNAEMDHIQLYLDIEKIRFGERLLFESHISKSCLSQKVPGMILQPLIENAIKHGVHESTQPVTIQLECQVLGSTMKISVSNQFDSTQHKKSGTGTGLTSVKKRLAVIYNRQDLVEINRKEGIFEVILYIPITFPQESA